MKVAFVIEYFPPFAPGGSEWSAFYLAKGLVDEGNEVLVITPNLGAKSKEVINGVKIIRFPFYLKSKSNNLPGNFAYSNPLWLCWSFICFVYFLKKENVDIIHVHGKYSIPPTVLANILLKKPILFTVRDYQVICNYGICLLTKMKACTLREYFSDDFKQYWTNYVLNKGTASLIKNIIFAIWGRLSRNYINFFAHQANIVVLSKAQKSIFKQNGFKKLKIIANSVDFPKNIDNLKKEKTVTFAGRLTPGKGVNLLLDILPSFFSKFPDYNFYFVGEGILKNMLYEKAKQFRNKIIVYGQVEHRKVLDLFKRSTLVVVPSVWPEPFGRVPIEAFSVGTPVVVTNRGGLPEIVDSRWGIITEANPKELLKAISRGIKEKFFLEKNLKDDFEIIRKKFNTNVVDEYIKIYNSLIK